jgi:hypothetical protein
MPVRSAKKVRAPYRELCIKLPTFIILALREMVKDANDEQNQTPPWTVDLLLERYLTTAITTEQLDTYARRSPNFKRAAEAWLRWSVQKFRTKEK